MFVNNIETGKQFCMGVEISEISLKKVFDENENIRLEMIEDFKSNGKTYFKLSIDFILSNFKKDCLYFNSTLDSIYFSMILEEIYKVFNKVKGYQSSEISIRGQGNLNDLLYSKPLPKFTHKKGFRCIDRSFSYYAARPEQWEVSLEILFNEDISTTIRNSLIKKTFNLFELDFSEKAIKEYKTIRDFNKSMTMPYSKKIYSIVLKD